MLIPDKNVSETKRDRVHTRPGEVSLLFNQDALVKLSERTLNLLAYIIQGSYQNLQGYATSGFSVMFQLVYQRGNQTDISLNTAVDSSSEGMPGHELWPLAILTTNIEIIFPIDYIS